MSQSTPSSSAESPTETGSETTPKSSNLAETGTESRPAMVTQQQAEEMIALLKSVKQNIFILTLVAGFFALRALLFHR